ncbi:unnamed protein product [Paramecium sonneborni]|uniref:glucose-6-phosphate isomerase n=1 Tax=Paramecium sonneborni TaxID=65129 RepID=A0A8S1LQD0_9CILI|nr:unnamed protein product [Paramecium sonneborni]
MDIQQKIAQYYETVLSKTHLRTLLDNEDRNKHMVTQYDGILLDYSHEKVDTELIGQFQQLVDSTNLFGILKDIQSGIKFNSTENRAVLHTALRTPEGQQVIVDGQNVVPDVYQILNRVKSFTESVRSGTFLGYTKKQLLNTVVIGIGGSYLGIEFIYEALRTHNEGQQKSKGRQLRFLANVDPVDTIRALQGLNVEETIFVINSKTFTTAETIMNAKVCRNWILEQYKLLGHENEKEILESHLTAVSTNLAETGKFGINEQRVFGFWDWVGGRYSVTSAIGVLPLSLQFGYDYIAQVLHGANSIDQHLINEKQVNKNLPVLLGLLGWYRASIQKYQALALIPYAQCLLRFPAHVQQVHMESNGKTALVYPDKHEQYLKSACPFIFGEPGTNSQHSFFQLIHQGSQVIPCEFIGYAKSQAETGATNPAAVRDQHDELMSNYFAQVDALARGKTKEEVIAEGVKQELQHHKVFPGDRCSLQILFQNEANPYNVGQLLALYEHRVLVEGILWGINPFDQWGVELGKVLAKNVRSVLLKNVDNHNNLDFTGFNANSATKNLISHYRAFQAKQ